MLYLVVYISTFLKREKLYIYTFVMRTNIYISKTILNFLIFDFPFFDLDAGIM